MQRQMEGNYRTAVWRTTRGNTARSLHTRCRAASAARTGNPWNRAVYIAQHTCVGKPPIGSGRASASAARKRRWPATGRTASIALASPATRAVLDLVEQQPCALFRSSRVSPLVSMHAKHERTVGFVKPDCFLCLEASMRRLSRCAWLAYDLRGPCPAFGRGEVAATATSSSGVRSLRAFHLCTLLTS